jgi:hypothetical protein
MSKMFAADGALEWIGGSFATELAIPGIGEVMAAVEAAMLSSILIGRKIKHHHDEKKDRKE